MEPHLDHVIAPRPSSRDQVARLRHDIPDFHDKPRWRMPSMFSAGIMFVLASGAFYGAEMVLPGDYKPSRFIGSYEGAIAEAQAKGRAAGELSTRIEYDKKFKVIETAALNMQTACKAAFEQNNAYYAAAWHRADMGFQVAGDMQKNYMAVRLSEAQQTTAGDVAAVNMATMFGYIGGIFDPELGQRSLEAADAIRQRALSKIEEVARDGQGVDWSTWSQGLPAPGSLAAQPHCEMPATLSPVQGAMG